MLCQVFVASHSLCSALYSRRTRTRESLSLSGHVRSITALSLSSAHAVRLPVAYATTGCFVIHTTNNTQPILTNPDQSRPIPTLTHNRHQPHNQHDANQHQADASHVCI